MLLRQRRHFRYNFDITNLEKFRAQRNSDGAFRSDSIDRRDDLDEPVHNFVERDLHAGEADAAFEQVRVRVPERGEVVRDVPRERVFGEVHFAMYDKDEFA